MWSPPDLKCWFGLVSRDHGTPARRPLLMEVASHYDRLATATYPNCPYLRPKRSEAENVPDRELLRRTDTIERRLCHTVYRCLIAHRDQIIPPADVSDVELNVP